MMTAFRCLQVHGGHSPGTLLYSTRLAWTTSAVKSSVNDCATSRRDSTIIAPVSVYHRVSYAERYSRFIARDFISYDTISRVESIFLWQHEDGCRAIRFRQNPELVTGGGGIRGQNAIPL